MKYLSRQEEKATHTYKYALTLVYQEYKKSREKNVDTTNTAAKTAISLDFTLLTSLHPGNIKWKNVCLVSNYIS